VPVMLTLAESARAVRKRDVSPVELVEQSLERAERWQGITNAFSQMRGTEALHQAGKLADSLVRGEPPGVLHGVPVVVKDLFDVAGWETSGCCLGYRGNIARGDAEVVRLLREAGAVIIGKTNQHELAAGGTNAISALGPTRNPWDPSRITGGSSGGSGAAVAARVVPLALGTDTGGSIRIPASLCGTAGLKPGRGRISLEGAMPLAPSLDTAGALAMTAEDLAITYSVLSRSGHGFLEEASGPVSGVSAGILGGFFIERVHPDVRKAMDHVGRVLEDLGTKIVEGHLGEIRKAPEIWLRVAWPEFAAAHGHLLRRPETLYPLTRSFLEAGATQTALEYLKAKEQAVGLRVLFENALSEVDVLIAPATPFAAPLATADRVEVGEGRFSDIASVSWLTRPINLTGLPALALPAGFSEEGLPLGVQLIGRAGEEALLLRVGRAFQEATDYHRRAPSPRAAQAGD
jgi:aspartyl-tRNA(Asn)/glutamyl-tRNA(Gln) amidotransferase subunit A